MNLKEQVEQTRREVEQSTKTIIDSINRHKRPEVYIPIDENEPKGKAEELREKLLRINKQNNKSSEREM